MKNESPKMRYSPWFSSSGKVKEKAKAKVQVGAMPPVKTGNRTGHNTHKVTGGLVIGTRVIQQPLMRVSNTVRVRVSKRQISTTRRLRVTTQMNHGTKSLVQVKVIQVM